MLNNFVGSDPLPYTLSLGLGLVFVARTDYENKSTTKNSQFTVIHIIGSKHNSTCTYVMPYQGKCIWLILLGLVRRLYVGTSHGMSLRHECERRVN